MVLEDFTEAFLLHMLVSSSIKVKIIILFYNSVGSIETGAYFVFYERLKSYFANKHPYHSLTFLDYLMASSTAKLTAVCLCYPHEVIRTRLRQENSRQ